MKNENTQATKNTKAMPTKEYEELLNWFRHHPYVVREVVFDSARLNELLTKLLSSNKARQASAGQDPTTFLQYMAGSPDGYPNAQCLEQTLYFCGKGTGIHKLYACGGNTGKY